MEYLRTFLEDIGAADVETYVVTARLHGHSPKTYTQVVALNMPEDVLEVVVVVGIVRRRHVHELIHSLQVCRVGYNDVCKYND